MKHFYIFCCLFFSFIAAIPEASSQDLCSQQLALAEDRFEQGKLYEIEGILSNCLEEGFTKEERIRAYRLLTLTYLYLNYHEKADQSYLQLLKLSPEYEYNEEVDEAELINHHRKFTTKPFVYLSGLGGVNFTRPIVLHENSMTDTEGSNKLYTPRPSYQFGAAVDILLHRRWYLHTGMLFSRKAFRVTESHLTQEVLGTQIDIAQFEIDVPLMLKYIYWDRRISPYFALGVSPHIMLDAVANTQSGTLIDNSGTLQPTRALPAVNISGSRRDFNYSLLGAVGFDFKAGINYVSVEVRYNVNMLNVINAKDNYRDDLTGLRDLKYTPSTTYVDDDYRNTTFAFLIGFTRPLYKPRKIE